MTRLDILFSCLEEVEKVVAAEILWVITLSGGVLSRQQLLSSHRDSHKL